MGTSSWLHHVRAPPSLLNPAPTQCVDNQPIDPPVEDFLLNRGASTCPRKYQPACSAFMSHTPHGMLKIEKSKKLVGS